VTANPTSGGTVSGGGTHPANSQVSISAAANAGHLFLGWNEGLSFLTHSPSHSFTITGNRAFLARFVANNTDCAQLAAIAGNQFINHYIDTLIQGRMANATDSTLEFGDMFRTVNGKHQSFAKRSYPRQARYTLTSGVQYTHAFHSHARGSHPFPSARDLYSLWQTYWFGSMVNASEYVYGIITGNSSVILQIGDLTKFNNYFNAIFIANGQNHTAAFEKFHDDYNKRVEMNSFPWRDATTEQINEQHQRIADFFNKNLGLRQKVSTGPPSSGGNASHRWQIYGTDHNGNAVIIDC